MSCNLDYLLRESKNDVKLKKLEQASKQLNFSLYYLWKQTNARILNSVDLSLNKGKTIFFAFLFISWHTMVPRDYRFRLCASRTYGMGIFHCLRIITEVNGEKQWHRKHFDAPTCFRDRHTSPYFDSKVAKFFRTSIYRVDGVTRMKLTFWKFSMRIGFLIASRLLNEATSAEFVKLFETNLSLKHAPPSTIRFSLVKAFKSHVQADRMTKIEALQTSPQYGSKRD